MVILKMCYLARPFYFLIQLFRERLLEKSVKVHAIIPKGSLGHSKYFFH